MWKTAPRGLLRLFDAQASLCYRNTSSQASGTSQTVASGGSVISTE